MKIAVTIGREVSVRCAVHGDILRDDGLLSLIGHSWCKKAKITMVVTPTEASRALESEAILLLPWLVTQSLRQIAQI